VSQVRNLTPNFTVVTLKCGLTAPKIAKNGNFWYKFAQKVYPLKRFLQNLGWGGSPAFAPSRQILPLWL